MTLTKQLSKISQISRQQREQLNGHKGAIVWLTGLSGAGKSTIAYALDKQLYTLGRHSIVLDGDEIRKGLCNDLGFSAKDRSENIRRVGELAILLLDTGLIVICAFISPFAKDREQIRQKAPKDFIEVFCDCPIHVCQERDPKELYKKVTEGKVKDFTGISSPYEPPEHPDFVLKTDKMPVEQSIRAILDLLQKKK